MKKYIPSPLWLIFVCATILFQIIQLNERPAIAMLRGVAAGSSGGGSTPGASCTNNGGVVYGSAGALVCSTTLTTDGKGNVSAGQTVVAMAVSAGGQTLNYVDTNIVASGVASGNTYVQIIAANLSNGNQASADFVTSINTTTATTAYCDFGQNSSAFSGTGSLNLPSAGYIYCSNSDLVFGTLSTNTIHFVTNNAATDSATVFNNLWTFNGTITNIGVASQYLFGGTSVLAGIQSTDSRIGLFDGGGGIYVFNDSKIGFGSSLGTWQTTLCQTSAGIMELNSGNACGATGTLQLSALQATGAISGGSFVANSNGVTPTAGNVGRYVPNTVASGGSTISTGSPAQAATVTLPGPGNYLVTAQCDFELEGSTTTITQCGIGNVTASMAVTQAGTVSGGLTIGNEAIAFNAMTTVAASGTHTIAMMPNYVQVSTANAGSPKLFLNCQATFSAGGMKCYGSINYIQMNYDLGRFIEDFGGDEPLVDMPRLPHLTHTISNRWRLGYLHDGGSL